MIKIKKINKEIVKPIPIQCVDPEKIKGYCLFPDLYCNVFLVARKKSGKTSAIFKILKTCVGKKTEVYIFASTIHKDDNLKHIVKYLKDKGNHIETFTSLGSDLDNIVQKLQDEYDHEDDEKEKKPNERRRFKLIVADDDEDDKPKPRKEKKLSPEYIFVFDDMGTQLRSPSVSQLLKTNRHYKSKVILSSQYVNDLMPDSRAQIDYYLIFGKNSEEKLEIIYKAADLPIEFDLFLSLYYDATKNTFNFFYVDVRDVKFRKNFNHEYVLKEDQIKK
jgi:hypothetical protein